jgi:serine/threonine protein kinase
MVGRFELIREVGRGGFGIVFKARDRERGSWVALKTIRPGARLEPARESLLREIEAGRLRHPNVVEVLEAGSCDRGPYVVFEYLSGETLEARLKRGPFRMEQVIDVAAAVARALAYAHAQGVLHRDLKPGNVFLPSTAQAKVIDFGLARIANSAGPPASGTSGYMSPEQRRGGREDERTDLFALGLIVHEMATGKPLLRRDRSGHDGAPSPSAPGSRVPPALEQLVAELVEEDPARRPGSAEEVLERLLMIGRRLAGTRRRQAPTTTFQGRMRCLVTTPFFT